jgi:hypothetical protein
MPWSVVVGGIYSPNHQSGRWGRLLSKGATGHCPVRQPRHPTVGVWPLELWQVGPPDSPVVHRTVTVHYPVRLIWLCAHYSRTVHFCRRPLALLAVAPLGTPDSPVNYSRVAPQIPEASELELIHPGAPDTVRWHTEQSGAPDQGSLRLVLLLSIWTLFWTFYWFVLNLWHL